MKGFELHKQVLETIGKRPLIRMAGGFWTYEGSEVKPENLSQGIAAIPVWYIGTNTVRAMEKKGLLKRTNKYQEAWRDNRIATSEVTPWQRS